MKIDPLLKQIITERFLKTAIRLPNQWLMSIKMARFSSHQLARAFHKNPDITIRKIHLAGLTAEEFKPSNEPSQMLIHLHGGAFFFSSLDTHRALMTQIAASSQIQILHIDYPLAPEAVFPTALNALMNFYHHLLGQGFKAENLILSGDSSGANLALALAIRLREENLPQVAGLVLMSPILDLTLTSPSLRYNQMHDALMSIECLARGIDYYLPTEINSSDVRVSPLFDDFSGLPATLVQVGSKELVLDDAKRFVHRAQGAGIDVTLKVYTGMWHNFILFQQWFAEGQQALADLRDFFKKLEN